MASVLLRSFVGTSQHRINLPQLSALSSSLLPLSKTATTQNLQHQYVARRSFFFFKEKENSRIKEIQVNEKSIGSKIKPGNLVDKFYPKTGNTRTLPVELAHGYFWMVGDLDATGGKPTLSNDYIIPAKNAEPFPELLAGVETLSDSDDKNNRVELPQFFLRKNRSGDEHAQCTLVAIACRDYGFKQLKSWTQPFQEVFREEDRVELVHLHITEGWFSSSVLQSMIRSMVKKNTPVEDHETTLLCFRKTLEGFRDSLRIHNQMTGYVFLLDGKGRIRFAGSGEATDEDVEKIIRFTHELTPLMRPKGKGNKRSKRSRKEEIKTGTQIQSQLSS